MTKYKYFVRVVVLNYNQPEYTISTVNALLLQKDVNKEIVVVDNFSSESNYRILEKGLSKEIILLKSDINEGYARGNNLGCNYKSENKIDYYFIINNDVIIEDENLIKSLISSIENNKESNVVAASPIVDTVSTKIPVDEQIQIRRILPFVEQMIVDSPFLNKIFSKIQNKYIYRDKMPYIGKYTLSDTINGAAFLINGKVFEKNGFFDGGTFLFHEELILGKQLLNNNYSCVLDGFSSVKHLQGLSTNSFKNSFNLKMEKEKITSEIYYFKLLYNKPTFIIKSIKFLRYVEMYLLYFIKTKIQKK
jgi:GT2 family glycosyltransferase